ncbi:MAG TPA: AbrB family transcriptional regulator [Alphaproteobacteria bacterium]|nr:AbrB family transcriptional regulator [Alphaproteobacteria bacterium]
MNHASFTLRDRSPLAHWGLLLAGSAIFIGALELVGLPAAILLGAMLAALIVSSLEGTVAFPDWLYVSAQGLVGCLIARAIGPGILSEMLARWPVFLVCVTAVIVFSTALGGLLAWFKVLPGTTAIWGSAPGAATAMAIMAEAFGADIRLVAFMQYMRVIFVATIASIVAHVVAVHSGGAPPRDWFPPIPPLPLAETLVLAIGGAFIGTRLKLPAGALLVPLFAGITLSGFGIVTITLPPLLLAACYTLVGWAIGRRFNREIVLYAAKAFPRVAASTLALIGLCGGLAWGLHVVAGTDPLTAYLATSPGGADSVAIIAASSKVDVPFVMAMQTARFLLVLLIGPSLARAIARRIEKKNLTAEGTENR